MNVKRWLEGFSEDERLNVQIQIPAYLWPVALALTDTDPEEPDDFGEIPITEAKAKALARSMGCGLPAKHDWFLGTTAG